MNGSRGEAKVEIRGTGNGSEEGEVRCHLVHQSAEFSNTGGEIVACVHKLSQSGRMLPHECYLREKGLAYMLSLCWVHSGQVVLLHFGFGSKCRH